MLLFGSSFILLFASRFSAFGGDDATSWARIACRNAVAKISSIFSFFLLNSYFRFVFILLENAHLFMVTLRLICGRGAQSCVVIYFCKVLKGR